MSFVGALMTGIIRTVAGGGGRAAPVNEHAEQAALAAFGAEELAAEAPEPLPPPQTPYPTLALLPSAPPWPPAEAPLAPPPAAAQLSRRMAAYELEHHFRSVLPRVDAWTLGDAAAAAAAHVRNANLSARSPYTVRTLFESSWQRAGSAQLLYLLVLAGLSRAVAQPASSLAWLAALSSQVLRKIGAADALDTYTVLLPSLVAGAPGAALAAALDALMEPCLRDGRSCVWVAVSPLLAASAWGATAPRHRPAALTSMAAASALRATSAEAAREFRAGVREALRALCADEDPSGDGVTTGALLALLASLAPSLACLTNMLAQPWPLSAAGRNTRAAATAQQAVTTRYADALREEVAGDVRALCAAAPAALDGVRGSAWELALAPTWADALLRTLQARARGGRSAGGGPLDAQALAAAASAAMLGPAHATALLDAAASLGDACPELLPLLLRRTRGGDAAVAAALPAARASAARRWLPLAASATAAGAHAVDALRAFAATRLWSTHAGPGGGDHAVADALHAEAVRLLVREGLAPLLRRLRGVEVLAEEAVTLRGALRELVAAEVHTMADVRTALGALCAAPRALHLGSPLLLDAAAAVLDGLRGSLNPGAPAGAPPTHAVLHGAAPDVWALVAAAGGAHAAELRAHPLAVRAAAATAELVAMLEPDGASAAASALSIDQLAALTGEATRPGLLRLLAASAPTMDWEAALCAAEGCVAAAVVTAEALTWLVEAAAASGAVDAAAPQAALAAQRERWGAAPVRRLSDGAFWGAALGPELRAAAARVAPLRGGALYTALWRRHLLAARAEAAGAGAQAAGAAAADANDNAEPPLIGDLFDDDGEPRGAQPQQLLPMHAVVTRVLPVVEHALDALRREAASLRGLRVGALSALLGRGPHALPDVGAEVERVRAFFDAQRQPGGGAAAAGAALGAALRAYAAAQSLLPLSRALAHVAESLELDAGAGGARDAGAAFASLAALVADDDAMVLRAGAAAETALAALGRRAGATEVLLALGTPGGRNLLALLRATPEAKMRELVDAVEDRGDSALRAETVDDAIKVRAALAPALEAERVEALLDALAGAAADGALLPRVLNVRESAHGLARALSGLADRSGHLREIMAALMARGTFSFAVHEAAGGGAACAPSAAADDVTYAAGALSDMHESALLLKRARDTAAMDGATEAEGGEGGGAAQRAALVATTFVSWMVHTQRIVDAVSALGQLGCIRYRGYAAWLPGADLEALAMSLSEEVAAWRGTLAAARSRCALLTFFSGPQLWCLSDALLGGGGGGDNTAARDLLQFVHRGAQLPARRADAAVADEDPAAWLTALGDALDAAFAPLVAAAPAAQVMSEEDVATSPIPRGVVNVMSVSAGRTVEALVGLFAASCGAATPARCQLLVCDATTSEEDVAALLLRAALAPAGCALFGAAPFVVAHVERLCEGVHAALMERLDELPAGGAWRLALLCDGARRQHVLHAYAEHVVDAARAHWWPASAAALGAHLAHVAGALVLTSDAPGVGKTSLAAATAAADGLRLRTLLMAGDMSRDTLVARLLALRLAPGDALHVKLSDVRDAQAAHCLLYELTQLRAVTGSAHGAAAVAHTHLVERFMLELAVPLTPGGAAAELARMPLLGAFERRHCVFSLDEVIVPPDVRAPLQLVCAYLDLLDGGRVDACGLCGLVDGDAVEYLPPGLQQRAAALPPPRCRALLQAHFFEAVQAAGEAPTYSALHVFLSVLATQLRAFTLSVPLTSALLHEMPPANLRSAALRALVSMARDFARASVSAARAMQSSSLAPQAADAGIVDFTERMGSIVAWEKMDTTLLVLDADGSLVLLRTGRDGVPIRDAINTFNSRPRALTEAASIRHISDQTELRERLHRMVGSTSTLSAGDTLQAGYVLTPDNVLKMAMIYMRIQSSVPVVMMGETGCGKTSLMTNLARAMCLFDGSPTDAASRFHVLNFHAGIEEADIVAFVERCEAQAEDTPGKRVVGFLDEVNTCGHLGLLSELVCRATLLGRAVHARVAFVAAVNPYRLRAGAPQRAAGLQRAANAVDPMARLVYRVYPLPEAMLQYVWDFGALSGEEQSRYLHGMMSDATTLSLLPGHAALAARLVDVSQRFIADHSAEWGTVSLRDPQRFKILCAWFKAQLTVREQPQQRAAAAAAVTEQSSNMFAAATAGLGSLMAGAVQGAWTYLFGGGNTRQAPARPTGAAAVPSRDPDAPPMSAAEIELRAILLALAHCYHCRLADSELRLEYLRAVSRAVGSFCMSSQHISFWSAQHRRGWAANGVTAADARNVIMCEQLDYLDRMKLPRDTVANEALRENVFTLLVCILLRMPVFLVGKPGCSKSLAIRRLVHKLRGAGSEDAFFATLPAVTTISFQGSSDSTSAGVRAVFDKALGYAALPSNALDGPTPTVCTVVLDEVGLAEESPHNPLKVLHALLESPDGSPLRYAVVGISNWSLDAAKMNRAVHVSRPDPSLDDLKKTALGIAAAHGHTCETWRLNAITEAYEAFLRERAATGAARDFHGLRDFYGLVKARPCALVRLPNTVHGLTDSHACASSPSMTLAGAGAPRGAQRLAGVAGHPAQLRWPAAQRRRVRAPRARARRAARQRPGGGAGARHGPHSRQPGGPIGAPPHAHHARQRRRGPAAVLLSRGAAQPGGHGRLALRGGCITDVQLQRAVQDHHVHGERRAAGAGGP
jgi:hypothetical protein